MTRDPHDATSHGPGRRPDDDDLALQARAELPPDPSEATRPADERAELAAYRALYAALREEEPDFALPAHFAEDLARRVLPEPEPFWDWLAPAILFVAGIQALGAFPATLDAVAATLRDTLPVVDPAALSLLMTAALALAALLLADRFIAPIVGALPHQPAAR